MVASSQPLASEAGLEMLKKGGHAVDAAVASAAVLNVVEPASTGIGGDLFALVWDNREKKVHALNASGRSGSLADPCKILNQNQTAISDISTVSITVPGAASGWEELITRFGYLGISEVLQPAISYASGGFPVSEIISSQWKNNLHRLSSIAGPELTIDGRAPEPGDIFSNPGLARVLQDVASDGADAFYKGDIADQILNYLSENGGWLTAEDLAGHRADWVEPACTSYRGVTAWECPPNTQGLHVLMALNIAEQFDIGKMGFQKSETYHHLIEAMRLSFSDGLAHISDPSSMRIPVNQLLSKDYAANRAKTIYPDKTNLNFATGYEIPHSDTVYLTVIDGEGNACSLINSIYSGFGSGHVIPGTGVVLQSRGASFSLDPHHPNYLQPRKRPFHTLIPGMATKNDELWISYGVMGTVQQAQGHFQMMVNMVDFDLSPQDALNAPRFSVRTGEGVGIESFADREISKSLDRKGHKVIIGEPDNLIFGGGQIIQRDAVTGVITGGTEPRQDGSIAAW